MRRNKFKLIIPGVIIIGFLTWLSISFITINTTINQNTTFNFPTFANLDNLPDQTAAKYAVAVDGEIAYGDTTTKLPTASTAKMILSLAIIKAKPFELGNPGETITITQEFYDKYLWYVQNDGSNSPVKVGQGISEYDALAATLIASSNNMADSLAIWAFGSIDEYRAYATKMLEEWGIVDTTIGEDASGFSDTTTSTPADLARIGTKVLENPVLAEIVNTKTYNIPTSGTLTNTNILLGTDRIIGIKTGYIGDASGYCLVSGYLEGSHIITTALLGAPTRESSFNETLDITKNLQSSLTETKIISAGDIIGYYESWWVGQTPIVADSDLVVLGIESAPKSTELNMVGKTGTLRVIINNTTYDLPVTALDYDPEPSFFEKFTHIFGWQNNTSLELNKSAETTEITKTPEPEFTPEITTSAPSDNCTTKFGNLMLINPNFTVAPDFINARKQELISVSTNYGIKENNPNNGDNLLDQTAAKHLNDMAKAYEAAYPGHTLSTMSCFRAQGTNCGRLCAATGASDHHTGLTCDLIDPVYGSSLDTDLYNQHPEWQWLRENSYKYGFIDRFPEAWAGGSMAEPLNVDENGSTGLFETWHYRYVGVDAATDIATGKYNNGNYDSLEHYLKARGLVLDLKSPKCK